MWSWPPRRWPAAELVGDHRGRVHDADDALCRVHGTRARAGRGRPTGVSALYVSPQAMHTNAVQARVALERLVHAGGAYTYSVSEPNWTALKHVQADLGRGEGRHHGRGEPGGGPRGVGMIMRRAIQGTPTRSRLSTHRHAERVGGGGAGHALGKQMVLAFYVGPTLPTLPTLFTTVGWCLHF